MCFRFLQGVRKGAGGKMEDIYFTMILYVDEDGPLKKAMESIWNTSPELQRRIRLVVADGICSERSMELCREYQQKIGEQQFVYLKTYRMLPGEAYNTAIPEIRGRYVNFSLASTWFSAGVLETVYGIAEQMERPKLISLAPWTVNEKHEFLPYKMSPKEAGNSYCEDISLNREPGRLQLAFPAYFIRCYLIHSRERHMWFRPELREETGLELLLNLLAEFRRYLYLPRVKLHYTRQLEDNTSAFLLQHEKWWYSDAMKNWILPFAENWNRKDYPLRTPMRLALLYLVYARFNCNYNDRNKGVLKGEEIEEFTNLAGKVLQYVDNSLIFQKDSLQNITIPRDLRMYFLKLKAKAAGKCAEVVSHGNRLCLWTHEKEATGHTLKVFDSPTLPKKEELLECGKELDSLVSQFTVERAVSEGAFVPEMKYAYGADGLSALCELSKEHVILRAVNYKNGKLEIDGALSLGDFLPRERIKLVVLKDRREFPAEFSEVYGLEKLFGESFLHKYMFHVSLPVYSLSKRSEIRFVLELNGQSTVLEIRANHAHAHLRADIWGQYWHFAPEWCLNISHKNRLYLTMVSPEEIRKQEADYQKELVKRARAKDGFAEKALKIRQAYFARKEARPGERIWITFDKLYKAGDNGEYMFDYISRQEDGIDIYYLIKRDSPDVPRLEQAGHILYWGEEETLVTALCAEAVLTTHANIVSYLGFEKELIPYLCDLLQPVNICIQHGLTVQDIAQFQNRLFDNLHLYLCASKNEIANLRRPIYGYWDPGALRLSGIARYDGLKSRDRHQILITPTWRRDIVNSNVAHMKKEHSDAFKSSAYYRIYNKLINDPRLLECAGQYGYRIIYLLHPAVSAQLEDFERNPQVELVPAAGDMNYEKILTESSLMVTDYSGVQFDFAYMKKPLLYYHPKTLPPHYQESEAYRYERDAFGPVLTGHRELVDALCEYMAAGCRMQEEYRLRAERFFAYDDFENCKRIYETIKGFMEDWRETR